MMKLIRRLKIFSWRYFITKGNSKPTRNNFLQDDVIELFDQYFQFNLINDINSVDELIGDRSHLDFTITRINEHFITTPQSSSSMDSSNNLSTKKTWDLIS